MQIEQRISGDVAIVTITGDITLQRGESVRLTDKVQSLLQQDYRKLVLDLGGVSFVDSAGLGELVQTSVTARKAGGEVKLLNVTRRLESLLTMTKLLTVFDTYDSEAEALASFGGAAKAGG